MDLHVCKSCGAIANVEVRGRCLGSRDGKHAWISGNLAEDYMLRLWRLKAGPMPAGAQGDLSVFSS